jgi:hypothetical protein
VAVQRLLARHIMGHRRRVESFFLKKPAFHAFSPAMAPLAIAVHRQNSDMTICHARPSKSPPYALCVASSLMLDACADVELRFIPVATGHDVRAPIVKK